MFPGVQRPRAFLPVTPFAGGVCVPVQSRVVHLSQRAALRSWPLLGANLSFGPLPQHAARTRSVFSLLFAEVCVACVNIPLPGAGLQETHLEVAQLALPLFLRRSASLLSSLVAADAAKHGPEAPRTHAVGTLHNGAAAAAAAASPRVTPGHAPGRTPPSMHVQEPLAAATAARARTTATKAFDDSAIDAAAGPTSAAAGPGADRLGAGAAAGRGACDGGGPGPATVVPGPDLELLEGLAVVVLQRLAELRVAPEVIDGAIPGATELRMLVERVRRARAHTAAAEAGEQTHVFVVYSAVAECAVVRSRAVRAAAASVLRVVGGLLPMGEALLGSA